MYFNPRRALLLTLLHVFAFSPVSWSESSITNATGAQQIAPPSYFLTPDEITTSRNSYPRKSLRPYTLTGNHITLLVNGDRFFEALYKDLSATDSGDFIWMTGWDIDSDVLLQPDPAAPDKGRESAIKNVLLAAINRGVNIRMLLNWNLLGPAKAIEFCRALNSAADKTVCAPDNRHYSNFGSLHQKAWVISRNNETIAYIGSMDIAAGRYDSHAHDQGDKWQLEPGFPINYHGWTGGMLKLYGAVVQDVANHLYDQLTDPTPPFPLYTLEKTEKPELSIGSYTDDTKAQVLLTAGPLGGKKGYYSNWAPLGETSFIAATIKAIKKAKRYIFISNQFLWHPPIIEAVAARLPYIEAVVLLTDSGYSLDYKILNLQWENLLASIEPVPGEQRPQEIDKLPLTASPVEYPRDEKLIRLIQSQLNDKNFSIDISVIRSTKFYYQHKAWSSLNPADPKVFAYTLAKEGKPNVPPVKNLGNIIYTHWKVMIIDDEFAIIGSAGAEQAGVSNDIDMSIGLFDPVVVSSMRKQLWAEYLNTDDDDPRLADPVRAIHDLWESSASSNGRVRTYWPKKISHNVLYDYIYQMFEPCGWIDESKCESLGKNDHL